MFRDIFKNKDCFFRVAKKVRSQKSVGLQGINKHDCCFSLIGGCFTRCLHTTRIAAGVCVCVCFVYFQLKTSPRRHNSRLWRPNGIRELAAAAGRKGHQAACCGGCRGCGGCRSCRGCGGCRSCRGCGGCSYCEGWPAGCQLIQGDGFRTHSNTVTLPNGFDSLVDVAAI